MRHDVLANDPFGICTINDLTIMIQTDSGQLKLNTDASVVAGLEFVGIGAIIRDEACFVMGAMAKKVPGVFSPLLAECIAIREGLQPAMDSGLRVHIIESDCSLAINKIVNFEVLAPDFPIIEDTSRLIDGLGDGSFRVISQFSKLAR
ncbi:hypothetical protein TIFTF001_004807 [Ficus carica]|uniref:RNase H type-1 domain-containing protein n=1 Tax=Ficus carica TaxID=3494 RepID=A0AA87ZE87_FICCA|nr:hypothetical protein TIFTF001_004807 [Ficus carica]